MTVENIQRTTPAEIASKGSIASLMSISWDGNLSVQSTPVDGKRSRSNKANVLPKPYFDKIQSVLVERRRAFKSWVVPTVFGNYMTLASVSRWSEMEIPMVVSLTEVYADMATDRDHIISNSRIEGRLHAENEWNRINPQKGGPSAAFYSNFEHIFASNVPEADSISSAMFWTEYHVPPPAPGNSPVILAAYGPMYDRLSVMFANQVVSGIKAAISDACDHVIGMVKKTGGMDMRSLDTMERKMDIAQAMFIIEDEMCSELIKYLKEISSVCYKDVNKTVEAATELKDRSVMLLDELLVEG
jgi:hypothetical protein